MPAEPPADEQPDAAADRSTRRKLLLAAGGAAASAVIGTVIGAVANRITSSEQAVRDDRAVEQAKRADAQRKPPVATNAYYYDRSDEAVVWALATPLTGGQRQRLLSRALSAEGEVADTFPDVVHGVVRTADERLTRVLTRLRISAVGQWTGPVFVRQIRARVLKRSAPLSGALLLQGSQGDGEPLTIGFDLDDPESVARVIRPEDETLGAAYVDRRALTLTPGEPVTVDVQAYTDRSYCEWVIELELDLGGERRVQVVDDHGRPFRSTGLAPHYQDRYHVGLLNGWTADGAGPPVWKL
ncbi:hypothetical protein ABZ436_06915 [Micromonospora matsumotoense]|uniref:hypothetical protein n=1 Tax=Micromonospora matsumotoense TaxID=121616 RepID=UPI0033E9990B